MGSADLPDNFLIGPDGVIIDRYLRGQRLNDKLQEIFQNNEALIEF